MTIISYFRTMFGSTSYKSNQFWWLAFKVLIVIASTYFIVISIGLDLSLDYQSFSHLIKSSGLFSLKNMGLLLILSSLNWFFEIKKWQVLTKSIKETSFYEAAKQSLSSLTFSLITPNRIGEYGAKALYFEKEHRKKVLFLNFAGNFYQLLVTLVIGCLGILYLPKYYNFLDIYTEWVIVVALVIVVSLALAKLLVKKIKWLQRVKEFWRLQNNRLILAFAFLRYLIFSHQFYFLLMIFEVDIAYIDAMACISSMYLISSLVPMLSLFDVALKGSVSIFVFTWFGGYVQFASILATVSMMWILNFALPALIGSYFVLTFKPIQKK